jgi:hypothetical protein
MENTINNLYKTESFDTDLFIVEEQYKKQEFTQTILYQLNNGEINEGLSQECLNKINPLLSNDKLLVCTLPVVKYGVNVYSVDDNNSIEDIIKHINEDKFVLLFGVIAIDGVLKFKSRLL